ncbi:hypothetical protein SAMN05661008_01032 [Alkalithermobacter thermoalcaliphilus JW-YL-7 = DSM 7308]|uniref:Uncharacterized protein n=1 Tax=Alkalithermobacter thermoalcaliphilus JW-YL-7 = DSM 7308 TaxID=1121328 RepID=A0A150FQE5_CLOPD|nr:hypothetical protein JWYL7_0325 [[Clostridium] paradoxum JW-YL-7 = DSM 7308]SHK86093.1 hypothetical protein SAMN05661008_01032 [[Clostridium] paradoxum JW-YL-7 = DSM 7308]
MESDDFRRKKGINDLQKLKTINYMEGLLCKILKNLFGLTLIIKI